MLAWNIYIMLLCDHYGCLAVIMTNRDKWLHLYLTVRGEILEFV